MLNFKQTNHRFPSRAALHPVVLDKPAVDFFDGALLGNGGMGVVVCTRPDALMLHFGHNAVWDIRVAERHADKVGTFAELFRKIEAIWQNGGSVKTDSWLAEYCKLATENYNHLYPRPYPCGSLILAFDRRETELLGHRLDLSNGVCEISLTQGGQRVRAQVFVDFDADQLWVRALDEHGEPCPSPFVRVKLMPDPTAGATAPHKLQAPTALDPLSADTLAFHQILPFMETCQPHAKDRAFRLTMRLSGALERRQRDGWLGEPVEMGTLERAIVPDGRAFALCVRLDEGLLSAIEARMPELPDPAGAVTRVVESNQSAWNEYWARSAVCFDADPELEGIWYRNLYFLKCALRPGTTCPGLWGNWSYKTIGTAWHGDYHMNYNAQQPFWVTFSSNHVDLHLPYVDMVDHLLPISRKWASEYYGLRGAYFPHSAYPTEMNIMPYWVPNWAWEICETPWTVQSLWWHYLYTLDDVFLRERAIGPLREAVTFLVDYMTRADARGPRWTDDKFHIFPTVVPELYGLVDRWEKNFDCIVDLTLTRFVFNAYLKSAEILKLNSPLDMELGPKVRQALARFPDYATQPSPRGTVFVSVPGESTEIVYNCPNSAAPVFPGEDIGLHSPPESIEIARNTYRQQRNEGGNDLVFLNAQAARLGILDLDRFKRQVRYCTLNSGASSDLVLQSGGRYEDDLPFDFMRGMGIFFENFALPFVINECLMQSYSGTIRFFPNWDLNQPAEFRSLRAAGAFLVSARCECGAVQWVEIFSERGAALRMIDPWTGATVERPTKSGETIRLAPG